jgi:hypothetical protein
MFIFFTLVGVGNTMLSAQKREDVYDKLENIGMYKRLDLTFDFKIGEKIIFTAEVLGGKKLKWIIIREPGSAMDLVAKKVPGGVERKVIPVQREGSYTFSFVNRSLMAKNVRVLIQREKPAEFRDTMLLEDLMVSSSMDTMPVSYIDTIPFPDVSQHSFVLRPTLDYLGQKDSCITEVLLEDPHQFAVYWIGIGDAPLKEYEKIKETPAPNWVLRGVNEPLIAYGLGLTKTLPESKTVLAQQVAFKFTNPDRTTKAEVKSSERMSLYGFIDMKRAGQYKKLMLCIRNFNANTPIPVHIKIAKFKVDKGVRNNYILRERTQEVYIKEKVLVEP